MTTWADVAMRGLEVLGGSIGALLTAVAGYTAMRKSNSRNRDVFRELIAPFKVSDEHTAKRLDRIERALKLPPLPPPPPPAPMLPEEPPTHAD